MSARVIHTVAEARAAVAEAQKRGATIGLVPTMGALHAGHGSLIDTARRETDFVVVSVFVNPIQFDRKDDYERYPQDIATDAEFCSARGVDMVFNPRVEEMYPQPQRSFVEVEGVTEHLCGAFRPGHFRGVATVVLKLFNIVQPNRAYFGEKDAQQLAVIQRMARDLNLPIEIVPVALVREPDGLALSSRNRRLDAAERQAALTLSRLLFAVRDRIGAGSVDAAQLKSEAEAEFGREPRLRVEYFEIVDADEMQPVERVAAPVRVAVAAFAGSTRLIDNVLCTPPAASH
ncbi:MAG: pantoate--beta-alanine ligase [Bryobacteraceae bacterium]